MEAALLQRYPKKGSDGMGNAGPPHARLEEGRRRQVRLLNRASEGVLVVRNGRVEECNQFLADQAGYAMDEIEGTCLASFFDRESIPAVEAVCSQIAAGSGAISLLRAVLVCKNGKKISVRLEARPCRFRGEPGVRVTLSALKSEASDDARDEDLDGFFISEETPLPLPQGI
jgi:PAS domain S-box-containing protein